MFEFVDLPGGAYPIHAARRGFMAAQYGQKNWRPAGQPVVMEQDQSTFLSIRLARFSSISGTRETLTTVESFQFVAKAPGPYELYAEAPGDRRGIAMGAYVPLVLERDMTGMRGGRPEGSRADGWNEITVNDSGSVRFVISGKPGGVHGTVTMGAHEPAGGAPVFLEAYDEVTHKRVVELRTTRTDMRGGYNFVGLAPGTYRLVSTFEYQTPGTGDIDGMSPRVFQVEEGRDQQQDLDVWVIR